MNNENYKFFENPNVKLIAMTQGLGGIELSQEDVIGYVEEGIFPVHLINTELGPEELSAIGALGCFEEKSSHEVWENLKKKNPEEREKIVRNVLRESAGRGHGSVLDQNEFIYSIENLPRAATLFLCGPEYLAHEQQSLRRATADRGYYLPEVFKESIFYEATQKILDDSFKFYERAVDERIPKEDARNTLPLYTKTNIQSKGNARELMHLRKMAEREGVPSVVNWTVEEMLRKAEEEAPGLFEDTGYNYETLAWRPSSQLFAEQNKGIQRILKLEEYPEETKLLSYSGIDMSEDEIREAVENRNEAELANLKHIHFEFLAPMSLSCFHQATRQRTWHQSVESIYDAAKRRETIIPPKISEKEIKDAYNIQNIDMFNLYECLIDEGMEKSEAVGVLPHSLRLYDLIHVDGWNAVHSIGKRTCTEAQWEIRNIAKKMADEIKRLNPALGKYAEPQCVTYEKCPEREPCGYYDAYKKKHGI